MRRRDLFAACVVATMMAAGGCTGTTTPTQVPTPVVPIPDPPHITCPAPLTAQSIDGQIATVTFTAPTVLNGKAPVTTNCTPSTGTAFSIGQKTVTCSATDALQRTDSCSFLVTVLTPPKLSATSFLAFGDSITYGEDGQNSTAPSISQMMSRFHPSVQVPLAEQYPEELRQSLAARYTVQKPTVANQGQRGEAAGDAATLARFMGLTATRQYSVVLLMEGTNDIFYGEANNEPVAIDGLRNMIRNAKGLNIRPYLATIPPTNPSSCDPVCRGRDSFGLVSGFNDRVRALASSEGVTLVDVYQGFAGNLAYIGGDGLHPSADGYAKIADLFFTAIKQTLETPAASGVLTRRRAPAAP